MNTQKRHTVRVLRGKLLFWNETLDSEWGLQEDFSEEEFMVNKVCCAWFTTRISKLFSVRVLLCSVSKLQCNNFPRIKSFLCKVAKTFAQPISASGYEENIQILRLLLFRIFFYDGLASLYARSDFVLLLQWWKVVCGNKLLGERSGATFRKVSKAWWEGEASLSDIELRCGVIDSEAFGSG